METTIGFRTKGGNAYLYDSQTSYMINCHPLVQAFAEQASQVDDKASLFQSVHKDYLDTDDKELEYYFQKFLFLKECGLFDKVDMAKHLSARISASIVEDQLANVNDLVFQTTNLCNLDCVYCCYGDLYDNEGRDLEHNVMDFNTARKVIDYLKEYWDSDRNLSHQGHIVIGFYGGEPLTNFPLIQQVVEYTQQLSLKNKTTFLYTMTTNSMLLDRYMDFLVKYDFLLLLSLDGNKTHNSLRVDKQGKPSFERVFRNIKKLQQTYPDYFNRRARFNSVLNIHSDAAAVHQYIYQEFGKETGLETITYSGIKKEKRDLFYRIYRGYDKDNSSSPNDNMKEAGYFFYYHIGNAYRHHIDLLGADKKKLPRTPTGTCLPFWKKMFVTPGGGIYACERIGFQHKLGQVNEKVNIDPQQIADKYNHYYENISKQCKHCYQADSCPSCMMQFEQRNGIPVCPSLTSKTEFQTYLSNIMSDLETAPDIYNKVNKMIFA